MRMQQIMREKYEIVKIDQSIFLQFGFVLIEQCRIPFFHRNMRLVSPLPLQAIHILHHIIQIAFIGTQARKCAIDQRALKVFIGNAKMRWQPNRFSMLQQN